jgi:SAM-dependent methyltransferase
VAKFEASNYSRFRLNYPAKLFACLRAYCGPFVFVRPMQVLDLGSGTGFSAKSFFNFFPSTDLTLVEPDPAMLSIAKTHFENLPSSTLIGQRAEDFQIDTRFDLVLVGSAWHWFNRALLVKNFEAAQVDAIFIFEYQFPKAKDHAALNEWVRREFNLRWRTTTQEPRGNLTELTQVLRDSSFFSEHTRVNLNQEESFSRERFWGMIVSQSRFLAYEETLSTESRVEQRNLLLQELSSLWGPSLEHVFILPYEGVFFLRRKI